MLFQHTAKGMSVQKTKPHQGYHAWHCENADVPTSTRVLAYTVYLNGVKLKATTEDELTEMMIRNNNLIDVRNKENGHDFAMLVRGFDDRGGWFNFAGPRGLFNKKVQ